MTALDYLNSFVNVTLQALTPEQKQAAINIAFLEIDRCAYGATAEIAAANLAAHNLLMEAAANSAGSGGGVVGELKRRKIGKREEEYFSSSAGSSSSGAVADEYDRTIYGVRFKGYRDARRIGILTSDNCNPACYSHADC